MIHVKHDFIQEKESEYLKWTLSKSISDFSTGIFLGGNLWESLDISSVSFLMATFSPVSPGPFFLPILGKERGDEETN